MGTDSSNGDDERSSTGILPSTTGDGSHASRWTEWLLGDGDRIAIAGAVAVLVFCFLVVAEALRLLYGDVRGPTMRPPTSRTPPARSSRSRRSPPRSSSSTPSGPRP